jgi:hypothetical protein
MVTLRHVARIAPPNALELLGGVVAVCCSGAPGGRWARADNKPRARAWRNWLTLSEPVGPEVEASGSGEGMVGLVDHRRYTVTILADPVTNVPTCVHQASEIA